MTNLIVHLADGTSHDMQVLCSDRDLTAITAQEAIDQIYDKLHQDLLQESENDENDSDSGNARRASISPADCALPETKSDVPIINLLEQKDPKAFFSKCFGLWICADGLRLQLMPEHRLEATRAKMENLIQNKNTAPEFWLERNGFFYGKDERIKSKVILRLLYAEARENIKKNIYPLTCLKCMEKTQIENMFELKKIEDLIDKKVGKTAAIRTKSVPLKNQSVKLKADDADQVDHPAADNPANNIQNDLIVAKAITSSLKYQNSFKKLTLKRSVSQLVKRQNSESGTARVDYTRMPFRKLYQRYLEICRTLGCYGGFRFEGQMERSFLESLTHAAYHDKKVWIVVNRLGVHIVNMQCPKSETFEFSDLKYGILIPKKENLISTLYLRPKSSSKLTQIFTFHADFIDKTMKSFIENTSTA